MKKGYIYVLSNPSMTGIVLTEWKKEADRRLKLLHKQRVLETV